MLKRTLIIFLFLCNSILASDSLSYVQDNSSNGIFSEQIIKLAQNIDLDIKIFSTLSLVDDRILEETSLYSVRPYKPTQQFFVLSYKF